jgi:predicted DNA-binding protein
MSPKKRLSDRVLTIRLPELEMERLEAYCQATKRTKTDVVREMIRKIKIKSASDSESSQ